MLGQNIGNVLLTLHQIDSSSYSQVLIFYLHIVHSEIWYLVAGCGVMRFGNIAVSTNTSRITMTCNEDTRIEARCMYNDTNAFWSGLIPESCDVSGKSSC